MSSSSTPPSSSLSSPNTASTDKGKKTNSSNNGVTEETSTETFTSICTHMNDKDAVAVHGMAKAILLLGKSKSGAKLTQARMKALSLQGCSIQATTCSGDVCERQDLVYPFDPPLKSVAECRPRLATIRQDVLAPSFSWLITKPLATLFLITFIVSGYVTLGIGVSETIDILNDPNNNGDIVWKPLAKYIAMTVFGSPEFFCGWLRFVFYFIVATHNFETAYTVHHCRSTLKLDWKTTLAWYTLNLAVGFPILNELQPLIHIQQQQQIKSQQENQSSKKEE